MLHAARQLPSWLTYNVGQKMKSWSLVLSFGVIAVFCGCDMPESRLAPIASTMAFAQHSDLIAAGVNIPADGSEFQLSAHQSVAVLERIRRRVDVSTELRLNPNFERYAVFLKEVRDPFLAQMRTTRGISHPFVVTVYEMVQPAHLDRTRDVFFMH